MKLKAGEIHIYVDDKGEFRPADEESWGRMKRMKKRTHFSFQYKRIRNYQFHKKFFAMLKLAFDNQDEYRSDKIFREQAMLAIGKCDTEFDRDGNVKHSPWSISFDKMDENEFEEVFQSTLSYLMERYGFDQSFVDRLCDFA